MLVHNKVKLALLRREFMIIIERKWRIRSPQTSKLAAEIDAWVIKLEFISTLGEGGNTCYSMVTGED